MGTITINPVTRISGFLEITAEVKENKIINAESKGLLFRGFEKMLQGRHPLDAIYFTERICGICSAAHSIASSLALENCLKVFPDENDKMLRDFLHGSEIIQNHIRHFYQYTIPDFVYGSQINSVYTVQHNDFRLPEKINIKITGHYIDSLKYSRLSHKMLAILGGKAPHNHGVFVGGVTVNIDASKIIELKSILNAIKEFVENTMIQDVYTIADYYKDYFKNGFGYENLMSYGLFDSYKDKEMFYLKPGIMINGKNHKFDPSKINENIYFAWYKSNKVEKNPMEDTVDENVDKNNGYSWIKAPRYDGYPMEVGPLARMWLCGDYKNGISTMDRTIARVLEVKKIIGIMENIIQRVVIKKTSQKILDIPMEAVGKGLVDTSRGALGHWVSIENKTIKNYEIITPSVWNLSPKDSNGLFGVVEKALIGTEINDIKNPVEIGRIVRSFDPCVSCAAHVINNNLSKIEIRLI